MEAGRHHSNDGLPGHGGLPVLLQDHLPVVVAMREDSVGPHTHPGGVLSNTHRVASIGDVGPRMTLVRVPQEGWNTQENRYSVCVLVILCECVVVIFRTPIQNTELPLLCTT